MNPFEAHAYGLMKAWLEHEASAAAVPRKVGASTRRKRRSPSKTAPVPAPSLFDSMDEQDRVDAFGTLEAAAERARAEAMHHAGWDADPLVAASNRYEPPTVDPQDPDDDTLSAGHGL